MDKNKLISKIPTERELNELREVVLKITMLDTAICNAITSTNNEIVNNFYTDYFKAIRLLHDGMYNDLEEIIENIEFRKRIEKSVNSDDESPF